ncbi:hypothetical protein BJV77DRAFT_961136 [Russula vinacea]|nr:hypothetical protein BJV77DRAFT_961136 [Russula vinacea]
MRSTTVVSFFIASWVLASPVFAIPVPSQVNSAVVKRACKFGPCRVADAPSNIDTASQSGVQNLVDILMNALQTYQAQTTPSGANTTADFATPQDAGAEPVPVVDAIEVSDV